MIVNYFVKQVNENGKFRNLFLKSSVQSEVRKGDEFLFEGTWMRVDELSFTDKNGIKNLEAICLENPYKNDTDEEPEETFED